MPCASPCLTCSYLTNNCTSCAINYYHNGICIGVCPVSHFANATSKRCDKCISPCSTCSNSTACLSCLPSTNTYYDSSTMQCVSICPTQYYRNNTNYTCIACVPPCVTCTSHTACLTCIASTYLYNSRCNTNCPSQYYANTTTNTCDACASPCLTCLSYSECVSCVAGYYYLYPNICTATCPYIINY